MKLKVDLNGSVIDLDGQPVAHSNMADLTARVLAYGSEGSPVKAVLWARELIKSGTLELSPEERNELKGQIAGARGLQNLTKAAIIDQLELAKELK